MDNMMGDLHGERGRLALRRLKRGECPTCGMKLYRAHGILGKRKTPLTILGRVFEGRCLLCCPEEQDTFTSDASHLRVPRVLTVEDDATVVSAITIEHSFARPGDTDYDCQSIDENAEMPPLQLSRPGPSGFGDLAADKDHRPKMPTRRGAGPPRPPQRNHSGGNGRWAPRTADRPQLKIQAFSEDEEHQQQQQQQQQEQEQQSLQQQDDQFGAPRLPQRQTQYSQIPPPIRDASSHDDSESSSEVDIVLNFRRRSRRASREDDELGRGSTNSSYSSGSIEKQSSSSGYTYPEELRSHPQRKTQPRHSLEDLSQFLSQLESSQDRASLLKLLTICIWDWGGPAKEIFRQENGVETLATLLWTDMTNTEVVQETARLVLALSASEDDHRDSAVLTQTTATEGLMDAFLITLHTLIHEPILQELACRIFCCLAADCSGQIHDGTLSGALQSVLNAMDAHQDNQAIQEWGVRALYNQCVYSANAEPNKRSLASATLDSGSTGRDVLNRLLQYPPTARHVEWCAQLYWLLSASADLAEMLSPANHAMQEMERLLRELHPRDGVVPVQEALLGTLANLMALEANRTDSSVSKEFMKFVLETMENYKDQIPILHESCYLLVVLTTNQEIDPKAASDGVRSLLTILKSPAFRSRPEATVLLDAALRALGALSVASAAAKETLLSDPHSLLSVLKLCRSSLENGQASDNSPELCCNLLASLFASGDERLHPRRRAIQTDAVEYVCDVMSRFLDSERLQDTACRTLRNFSCFPECSELIFRNGAVKFLIDDMKVFREATGLHSNACSTLWNLKLHVGGAILTADDIECIVTTLQNHLEDQSIVLMACGALWSNVFGSDDLKRHLVATDGGVDAIACVLVMHPTNEQITESACGLLTSLTVKSELVEGVVSTEGFANMVDIMRSDRVSVSVLKAGAMFMRNVCLAYPEFANEASSVVPPLIQAMKNNTDDAAFQKEACSFLWLVAAQSADTKSKILALDGVAILMSILESYSGVEGKVEEVALGAFRELALSSTGF